MADLQYELRAPNGEVVRRTNEQMLVAYPIEAFPGDDGTIAWDYTGGEREEFDETAEPIKVDGEITFLDESGNEWKLSELSLHPVNDFGD